MVEGVKRFFKLFQESTFEEAVAAQSMTKFAKRQRKLAKMEILYHSTDSYSSSNSEMLSWLNSPLLVMLQSVDPNELFSQTSSSANAPHAGRSGRSFRFFCTHVNQLILAKQLVEHGANVNAV
jgi:hypothetical protein